MRISLFISILFSLVFATSLLNAQTGSHSNNQSLWGDVPQVPDDVFIFSYGTNKIDTTFELIDCPGGSDSHQRIDIYWHNGIPRHGIITDCSEQRRNVNYIPMSFNPPKGVATSGLVNTKVMSHRVELYTKQPVTVLIMNLLTGDTARKIPVLPIDTGTYVHYADTTLAHIEPGQTEPAGFFHFRAADMPTESTHPRFIDYANLSSGLYFVIIIDTASHEVLFIKTIRKGIE